MKIYKKMLLGIALSMPLVSQALDIYWFSDVDITVGGVKAESSDGYIATFWAANQTQGGSPVMVATSLLSQGLWGGEDGATWVVDLPAVDNDDYYTSVRVFQYKSGQAITGSDLSDFAALTMAWNLIQGTDVVQGMLESTMSVGVPPTYIFASDTYATSLPLAGIPNTPVPGGQVPEPSTYAALAGLAVLAFVAVRRVRK